jgi:hypothetical protein
MLAEQGLQLITTLKKNRKPEPRTDFDKAILRRRSLIETVFDELKNLCQIEHTRHRSHFNFVVNLWRTLRPIACPTTSPRCL